MVWDFKEKMDSLICWESFSVVKNAVGCHRVVVQEDDIDGEHIVAFAEEDDPGE